MTTAPETAARPPRRPSLFDRLLGWFPLTLIVLCVLGFYAVQASLRHTPWVFSDELEWSQISRAIATTGHPARRGQPVGFKSLYAFLLTPFWWIHSTATAYAAIKYMNAVVMSLAAVPTYLLARMVVARRAALAVAVLSVAIPAMSYATTIVPENLAYPWYALSSWLIVRALAYQRRRDTVIAIGASLVAMLVRSPQFGTIGAAYIMAAAGLWLTGPRGRHWRRNWSRSDSLGALVLFIGALFLFNRLFLQHIEIWQVSTQHYKNRMIDLGLRAAIGFFIGLGVLPVIGGLASLRIPERRGEPVYRAFAAYAGATIVCVGLYTAVKSAYLSTVFSTLWEERNLFYLSPILLTGTALCFASKRLSAGAIAAATALVLVVFVFKPYPQLGTPYFESPGLSIPTLLAQDAHFSIGEIRVFTVAVTALSVALLVVRRTRGIAVLCVLVGLAWMLTAEINTSRGVDKLANAFRTNLVHPLDWVDVRDHGKPAAYLGQGVRDPNGIWLTEFWNRTIKRVESLDGSTSQDGPGPSQTPSILDRTGRLSELDGIDYVVADNGVTLQAPKVYSPPDSSYVLYRKQGPWRLLDEDQAVYSDDWVSGWSTYTYFHPGQTGTVYVTLSRLAYNGNAPAAHVEIDVGGVAIDANQQPELVPPRGSRHLHRIVNNGTKQIVPIKVTAPFRLILHVPPADLIPPTASEPRTLGVQVAFSFTPSK